MTIHHSPFARAVARISVLLILFAAAHAARPSLREIYDAHRWFDLRQAVRTQRAPLFYRGAVAYALAEDKRCTSGRSASGTTRLSAIILAMASTRGRRRRAGGPRSGCTGRWRPAGPKRCWCRA